MFFEVLMHDRNWCKFQRKNGLQYLEFAEEIQKCFYFFACENTYSLTHRQAQTQTQTQAITTESFHIQIIIDR